MMCTVIGTNKCDSNPVLFFRRYHSFKTVIFFRSHYQEDCRELCWRQWENLWPDGKDQEDALEQPGPRAWRTTGELLRTTECQSASTRLSEMPKFALACVILQPRPRSGMEFANSDNDSLI